MQQENREKERKDLEEVEKRFGIMSDEYNGKNFKTGRERDRITGEKERDIK